MGELYEINWNFNQKYYSGPVMAKRVQDTFWQRVENFENMPKNFTDLYPRVVSNKDLRAFI